MTSPGRWFGSLGWRLLAAFVTVAVGAIFLLALTAAASVDRHTSDLIATQRAALKSQVASALAAAYTAGRGSWTSADLRSVRSLAQAQGSTILVMDGSGHRVAMMDGHDWMHWPTDGSWDQPTGPAQPTPSTDQHHSRSSGSGGGGGNDRNDWSPSPGMSWQDMNEPNPSTSPVQSLPTAAASPAIVLAAASPSPSPAPGSGTTVTVPIVVDGAQVGTAQVTLPAGAESSVTAARAALLRSLWLGTALAVALAVAAAAVVTRRVSRPLVALASATRAFAAGEPHPELLLRRAPGELGEVGQAFTQMTQRLSQQDEVRRTLVADVAHELRTPVTILRGQTEQLLDGIADPTTERLLSLHDEVLRLERLTEDLATLSTADAAGLALHREPVDVGQLAGQVVAAMQSQFDDAELAVKPDIAAAVVDGDSARLAQVITNLLTNAIKFTPPGGEISVAVTSSASEVQLTVTDSGTGIPTDELPHVFDRFWRGRGAGARSGTGIGLAVVHSLVEAHGGTVTAGSPSTGGTVFTVVLPALAAGTVASGHNRMPQAL
ncbi:MAG: HAMP domain-containing sensor histidine kinase [Actinomycetes bacterium]